MAKKRTTIAFYGKKNQRLERQAKDFTREALGASPSEQAYRESMEQAAREALAKSDDLRIKRMEASKRLNNYRHR